MRRPKARPRSLNRRDPVAHFERKLILERSIPPCGEFRRRSLSRVLPRSAAHGHGFRYQHIPRTPQRPTRRKVRITRSQSHSRQSQTHSRAAWNGGASNRPRPGLGPSRAAQPVLTGNDMLRKLLINGYASEQRMSYHQNSIVRVEAFERSSIQHLRAAQKRCRDGARRYRSLSSQDCCSKNPEIAAYGVVGWPQCTVA